MMVIMGREAIERVREGTDIIDLIGRYFPLRKTGQNFKARCPFHEEKTASFVVSPTRQFFHCFGCGEKGSVFDFVMRMERVEFRDALQILADQAGITLDPTGPRDGGEAPLRSELYRVHEWAADFFRRALGTDEGRACRQYVTSRRITEEMAQAFRIGYAPGGWTLLVGRAQEAGFGTLLLEKAGLALPGSKRPGHYDRFRDRLMFPIRDALGRVVAFGARSLDGSEPKYLNSPETDIFHKSRTLFGLERLRDHPRDEPVLVMEGYTDVIMSAQMGVSGAVATLGTALTGDHARLLSRYTDRIVLVYDGDPAGLSAAEKGALLLLEAGHLHIKVAVLPGGEDPSDFFLTRGADGREELLAVTTDLLDFLLVRSSARFDLESVAGRRGAADQLLRAAAAVSDPVARDLIIQRVGEHLRLGVSSLREAVESRRRGVPPERVSRAPVRSPPGTPQGLDVGHRALLEALVNAPELVRHPALVGGDPPAWIHDSRIRTLIGIWMQCPESIPNVGLFLDVVEDPSLREVVRSLLLPEDHGKDLRAQLEGALGSLRIKRDLEEVRQLSQEVHDGADSQLLMERIQQKYKNLKGASRGQEPTNGGALR
jgi:DNA primase